MTSYPSVRIVINFMRGVLNSRPPRPRYAYTWDLGLVTRYLKRLSVNSGLSPKQLSWKLAILFAITCPKRVSSLASLDLNHHRDLPEGVAFTLTVPTRGTRPDQTVQAFFACYPSETSLCPVDCLKH